MQIVDDFELPVGIQGGEVPPVRQRGGVVTTREEAISLLGPLSAALALTRRKRTGKGGGRRDSRRWTPPEKVTFEIYDGATWHPVEALDCGIPGVRVADLPGFVGEGPALLRLTTPDSGAVLVTGDVMWQDPSAGTAGLRFTFQNDEDREAWFEGLVEALLSRHAMD